MTTPQDFAASLAKVSREPAAFENYLSDAVAAGYLLGSLLTGETKPHFESLAEQVYHPDVEWARYESYKLGIAAGMYESLDEALEWFVEEEDFERIDEYRERFTPRDNERIDGHPTLADAADLCLSYMD